MEGKGDALRTDQANEVVDNKNIIGDVFGETPPLPPPKEVRSWPRKQEAILNVDPYSAVHTDSSCEPPRHLNDGGVAVAVAIMRELGQSIAGSTERARRDSGGNEGQEHLRKYYFDLGRSMMLGSFE